MSLTEKIQQADRVISLARSLLEQSVEFDTEIPSILHSVWNDLAEAMNLYDRA